MASSSSATSGVSISYRARGTVRGKGMPRKCRCGEWSIIRTSETEENPGRLFYCCPYGSKEDNFHLFKWTDISMVEEIEELETVVEKIQMDVGKLEKDLASDMETLACETRTCEAVVSSFGNEIQAIKALVEGCGKEIEVVKSMVSSCEKEINALRSFKNLIVGGLVLLFGYYLIFVAV